MEGEEDPMNALSAEFIDKATFVYELVINRIVEILLSITHSFTPNAFEGPFEEEKFSIIVHNDDIHTYDDVQYLLKSVCRVSLEKCNTLTKGMTPALFLYMSMYILIIISLFKFNSLSHTHIHTHSLSLSLSSLSLSLSP